MPKPLMRCLGLLLLALLGWGARGAAEVRAASPDNPRLRAEQQERTVYHWYLARWDNNQIVCHLYLPHPGYPTREEVRQSCGEAILQQWVRTPPCNAETGACRGLYLVFAGQGSYTEIVFTAIAPPQVYLSLPDCQPQGNGVYRCPQRPRLRLKAVEPMEGERIVSVQGQIANLPLSCEGDLCEVQLSPTSARGADLIFWARSSLGDSSQRYQALLRVQAEDPTRPDLGPWWVTLASTQMADQSPAPCAEIWWALPAAETEQWLQPLAGPQDLASAEGYTYLAGRLIAAGQIDAAACLDGGLLPNGFASPCGLEAARPALTSWQNRFDAAIWAAAQKTAVPPLVLKRVLAQESQFWPDRVGAAGEFGLGQLSLAGTDTVLLWSPEFFAAFCPQHLSPARCAAGYASLTAEEQALLRGAVMKAVDALCPTCELGLDLEQAEASVEIFAYALQASCRQVDQVMRNLTGQNPGWTTSYEDLWRFTLANYNAGAGCLSTALEAARQENLQLSWHNVAPLLDKSCPSVQAYVDDVARP